MKRAVIATMALLIPLPANAIVRYMVQNMTCDEVHEAIDRDGAAILYRQATASGLPLYNRYVKSAEFCEVGEKIANSSVATADTQSCKVIKCERVSRP